MDALRIKNQAEFAKALGFRQTTVSAWMTGDSLPSPDAYMRLGSRALDPADSLFFWERGGLAPEAILSAANKVFGERILRPGEGDLSVPAFEGDIGTGQKKTLRLPARILPSPASTCFLEIGEGLAGVMLKIGDLLILERNLGDLSKPGPFFGESVLLERPRASKRSFDFTPTGLVIGWLNLQSVLDPRYYPEARTGFYGWAAGVYPLNRSGWSHFYIAGYPGDDDNVDEVLARGTSDQAREKAAEEMRITDGTSIRARVVGWFPGGKRLLEEEGSVLP